MKLENCPAHVREWMDTERLQKSDETARLPESLAIFELKLSHKFLEQWRTT